MKEVNIIEAIKDENLFRPLFEHKRFENLKTMSAWMTWLKALYGIEMEEEEKKLYQKCTGRVEAPTTEFKEAYCICGRRGGKSFISAVIAVFSALFGNWEKDLSPGETAFIFTIATDRTQAKIVLDYVRGMLSLFPDMIEKDLTWEIRLTNRVTIAVKTCGYRGTRGFTTAVIILDELAHFKDERSANPAEEVIYSLEPGLLENGLLIGISTTHRRWGYLYNMWKEHYGKDESDVLMWTAPTLTMNPTYSEKKINRFMRRDASVTRSEYFCEWREDLESYLTEEEIKAVTDEGVEVRAPKPGIRYKAFTDPSGGKADSFTLAIAHTEDNKIILDRVEEVEAPFNPRDVTRQFCDILKVYNCHQVTGDRFSGNWVSGSFKDHGINYIASELPKSDLYLDFQAIAKNVPGSTFG